MSGVLLLHSSGNKCIFICWIGPLADRTGVPTLCHMNDNPVFYAKNLPLPTAKRFHCKRDPVFETASLCVQHFDDSVIIHNLAHICLPFSRWYRDMDESLGNERQNYDQA